MSKVTIRELTHHFAKYLKVVKAGNRIIILERNTPVAEIIPHNENLAQPGWKRPISKVKITGETFSDTIIHNRRDERA